MSLKRIALLSAAAALALAACGPSAESVIATGIAQTQQISELQTAAAGPASTQPPAATETPAPTEGAPTVTTTRDVNMRAGDSTAYGVMTVIPGGETVEVTGVNQAGTWVQVYYHNATGWISTDFITGDVPAGLPVATPSAQPSGGDSGGGGGTYDEYTINLSIDDDQSKSVSGQVSGSNMDRITIYVDFSAGPNSGEVDIAFQCTTSNPEHVKISAPGADDNVICNNNWSHAVDSSHNTVVVTVKIEGGGSTGWTLIANVTP